MLLWKVKIRIFSRKYNTYSVVRHPIQILTVNHWKHPVAMLSMNSSRNMLHIKFIRKKVECFPLFHNFGTPSVQILPCKGWLDFSTCYCVSLQSLIARKRFQETVSSDGFRYTIYYARKCFANEFCSERRPLRIHSLVLNFYCLLFQ